MALLLLTLASCYRFVCTKGSGQKRRSLRSDERAPTDQLLLHVCNNFTRSRLVRWHTVTRWSSPAPPPPSLSGLNIHSFIHACMHAEKKKKEKKISTFREPNLTRYVCIIISHLAKNQKIRFLRPNYSSQVVQCFDLPMYVPFFFLFFSTYL